MQLASEQHNVSGRNVKIGRRGRPNTLVALVEFICNVGLAAYCGLNSTSSSEHIAARLLPVEASKLKTLRVTHRDLRFSDVSDVSNSLEDMSDMPD